MRIIWTLRKLLTPVFARSRLLASAVDVLTTIGWELGQVLTAALQIGALLQGLGKMVASVCRFGEGEDKPIDIGTMR